ncbi:hypothetical protein QJS66_12155 [Kocuria rhizophila]|nr:hypothetical protein QJS66_12155 [Kocuria rhizophila]
MSAPRPRHNTPRRAGTGRPADGPPWHDGERVPSSAEVCPAPELRWAGTHAFLPTAGELADVVRWHAHLTAHPFAGQTDVTAAARTAPATFTDAPVGAEGRERRRHRPTPREAGGRGQRPDIPRS